MGLAEEQLILDSLGMDEAMQFASAQGVDLAMIVRQAISGEISVGDSFSQFLGHARELVFSDFVRLGAMLLAPALAMLMIRLLMPEAGGARRATMLVCRVSCIAGLAEIFADMRSVTQALMSAIAECADLLTPVMITAVSLAGAETTALFLTPFVSVCVNLIQHILAQWGVAISSAAAAIAIAGSLSESVKLKRLHNLCRRIIHVGAGGLLTGFVAILTIQGRLGAGRDGAAVRTARYAIENILPVIGGNVSDSLDSLLSTAYIVKNAFGVSSCILIAAVCLVPMLRLLAMAFFLHFVSAAAEPMGDDSMTAMLGELGAAVEMLLIVAAVGAVLCALLIGSCMSAASNVVR